MPDDDNFSIDVDAEAGCEELARFLEELPGGNDD